VPSPLAVKVPLTLRLPVIGAEVQLRGSRPADARSKLPLSFKHDELAVHVPTTLPPHAVTLVQVAAAPPPEAPVAPDVFPLLAPLVPTFPLLPPGSGGEFVDEQAPKLMAKVAATANTADCTFINILQIDTSRA
jgi:hypothetical protein